MINGIRQREGFSGGVSYGQNVILSIVTLAAKEISGVASLRGRGVRMERAGANTLNIDVYINILSGYKCPDVAFKVQENIKRSIETMSAFKAGEINVNVLGVSFTEPEDGRI